MTDVRYRRAAPEDAAALAALGRRSFTETFGHLYKPEDLAAFLANHSKEGWAGVLSDPSFAVRVAEVDGAAVAYAKLGPPSLPFEPRGPSIELRQFYVLAPWHGSGIAAGLMQWAMARRRRGVPTTSIFPCSSTITAPAASTPATASNMSAIMSSWSALMPIWTMCCACR